MSQKKCAEMFGDVQDRSPSVGTTAPAQATVYPRFVDNKSFTLLDFSLGLKLLITFITLVAPGGSKMKANCFEALMLLTTFRTVIWGGFPVELSRAFNTCA